MNPWQLAIAKIMNAMRYSSSDQQIADEIEHQLRVAYAQGFSDADRNTRQPESMGR